MGTIDVGALILAGTFALGIVVGAALAMLGMRVGAKIVWRAVGRTEPLLDEPDTPKITQTHTV